MRFVISSMAALLLATCGTPAMAQFTDVKMLNKAIEICQIDLEMYQNGDRTWLERQIKNLTPKDQLLILNVCHAYNVGILKGAKSVTRNV